MVKAIYNIEPTYRVYPEAGTCNVWLTYQGKTYRGLARLSPEDKDFFSEKVGLNIALSRARIKILKEAKNQAKLIADIKYRMYQEAANYGKVPPATFDPTGTFLQKAIKAQNTYQAIHKALKREKKYLSNYIKNQDKMIKYIKRIRARDKTE